MHAEGSVLVSSGNTKIICTASVENKVPGWLLDKDKKPHHGWVTSEYVMLPRSTGSRRKRETGKIDGRSQEIQRLIGRSLRSVVNLSVLGEHTIWIYCDVIHADGCSRTPEITATYKSSRIYSSTSTSISPHPATVNSDIEFSKDGQIYSETSPTSN